MAIEIVDFPINNGGSFHSYFDITRGYPIWWFLDWDAQPHGNFKMANSDAKRPCALQRGGTKKREIGYRKIEDLLEIAKIQGVTQ